MVRDVFRFESIPKRQPTPAMGILERSWTAQKWDESRIQVDHLQRGDWARISIVNSGQAMGGVSQVWATRLPSCQMVSRDAGQMPLHGHRAESGQSRHRKTAGAGQPLPSERAWANNEWKLCPFLSLCEMAHIDARFWPPDLI